MTTRQHLWLLLVLLLAAVSFGSEIAASTRTDSVVEIDDESNNDQQCIASNNASSQQCEKQYQQSEQSSPPTPESLSPASDEEEEYFDDEEDYEDEEWMYDDDDVEYEEDAEYDEEDYEEDFDDGSSDEDVGLDMGVAQDVSTPEAQQRLEAARNYMQTVVWSNSSYDSVKKLCTNTEELCAYWAAEGECESNEDWMTSECGPVCFTCDQMHVATRCPMDASAADALYPGNLDVMFERIVQDPSLQHYQPTVVSRPWFAPGHTPETASYQLGLWIVQFDNITTAEEAARMIELADVEGYERSADVGEEQEDGSFGDDVNEGRTSTNAWCQTECLDDPVAKSIMQRMEHITGISEDNQEHLQLLRYEPGQLYGTHNDYIHYQLERPSGVRILTFYIYLNDVEEGGETCFPRMAKCVEPKVGRAILWPSIFNHDPNGNDLRSDHEARPVIRGIKYGANAWIHQRGVKSQKNSCL